MSNAESQITKIKNVSDVQLASSMTVLQDKKEAANIAVNDHLKAEQENKHHFRSAKSRQAMTGILNHDFTSAKWILQKKGKRDTKKNIQKTYRKLSGDNSLFGGLSRSDKAQRKSEFETRRIRSAEASRALAEAAAAGDLGEEMDEQQMAEALSTVNVEQFNIADDSVFVENFAKNMKFLQQAEMLLDYYNTEEGQQAFGQNEEIASKLYWMVNIKAAYMERITIISSPYYVSMREEDFTPKTRAHMEKELKKKDKGKLSDEDRAFYKAYLSYYGRQNDELRGREIRFRFKTGKEEVDNERIYNMPENRLKSKYYEELRKNPNAMKSFNEKQNADESGKVMDRFFHRFDWTDTDGSVKTSLNCKDLAHNTDFMLLNRDKRVEQALYGDTDSYNLQLKKDEFIESVKKMDIKIDETLKAHDLWDEERTRFIQEHARKQGKNVVNIKAATAEEIRQNCGKEPLNLSPEEKAEFRKAKKVLSNIIEKVNNGEISMDTASVWLDRTFGQKNLEISVGGNLLRKELYTQKREETYPEGYFDMNLEEKQAYDEQKKQQKAEDRKKLGSIVYNYSRYLGSRGYINLSRANGNTENNGRDTDVRRLRFVHRDKLDTAKMMAVKNYESTDNFSGDMENVFGNLGENVGNVIQIRGGFFGNTFNAANRVMLSTSPAQKNKAVEDFLEYAKNTGMLNYLHISIGTGIDGPRNDDITITFSEKFTRAQAQEFMQNYSSHVAETDPELLCRDEKDAAPLGVKLADGITMAPQFSVNALQWVKELTPELEKYSYKGYDNTESGYEHKARMKKQQRPADVGYSSFIIDQIGMSYLIAHDRLRRMQTVLGRSETPDLNDDMLRAEMKKVFRELLILNGVDPETMTSVQIKEQIEAEKKSKNKISLKDMLDKLEAEHKSQKDE